MFSTFILVTNHYLTIYTMQPWHYLLYGTFGKSSIHTVILRWGINLESLDCYLQYFHQLCLHITLLGLWTELNSYQQNCLKCEMKWTYSSSSSSDLTCLCRMKTGPMQASVALAMAGVGPLPPVRKKATIIGALAASGWYNCSKSESFAALGLELGFSKD